MTEAMAPIAGVLSDRLILQLESKEIKNPSLDKRPPTCIVKKSGAVPHNPKLQFEAAWALTKIAVGISESTKLDINSATVPFFVQLLASLDDDVREQAIWELGKVAGYSIQCRDFIGALMPLFNQLNEHLPPFDQLESKEIKNPSLDKSPPTGNMKNFGAVPHTPKLQLLASPDDDVREQAIWELGKVAGYSIQCRDFIGALIRLFNQLNEHLPPFDQPARDSESSTNSDSSSNSESHSDSSSGSGGSGGSDSSGSGSGGSGSEASEDSTETADLRCTGSCILIQMFVLQTFWWGRHSADSINSIQTTVVYDNVPTALLNSFCDGWNLGVHNAGFFVTTGFADVILLCGNAGYMAGCLLESLFDHRPKALPTSEFEDLVSAWKLAGYVAGTHIMETYGYERYLAMVSFWQFFTLERF